MIFFYLWLLGVGLVLIYIGLFITEEDWDANYNDGIVAALFWPIVIPLACIMGSVDDKKEV